LNMQWTPYLVMDGNAEEAADFYAKALGGVVSEKMRFGDMPPGPQGPMPEEIKSRITHVRVVAGSQQLMLSDTHPGMAHQIGNHVTISIGLDDPTCAREIFAALCEGAHQIVMPIQETFFSPAYGQVIDKYGVFFHVNVPPAQA